MWGNGVTLVKWGYPWGYSKGNVAVCAPARIGRTVHCPIDEPGMRIPRAIPAEISGQTHQSINNTKNKMQNQVGFSFNAKMAEWEKSFPFLPEVSSSKPTRATDRPHPHQTEPTRPAPRRAAAAAAASDARPLLLRHR